MGPPPTTITDPFKYDINQDYYLCEKCATQITLHTQLLKKYDFPGNNKHYLLFEDLSINVVPDNDYFISNKKTTVRSTYCAKCSSDLGFKFIALEEPKDEIQEGRFIVFANKLILWKGKKLLDAVTEEPVVMELLDGVAEELADEPLEKKSQTLAITEQLKLLLGVAGDQDENKLLDGMTEEPVEKNVPEGGSN